MSLLPKWILLFLRESFKNASSYNRRDWNQDIQCKVPTYCYNPLDKSCSGMGLVFLVEHLCTPHHYRPNLLFLQRTTELLRITKSSLTLHPTWRRNSLGNHVYFFYTFQLFQVNLFNFKLHLYIKTKSPIMCTTERLWGWQWSDWSKKDKKFFSTKIPWDCRPHRTHESYRWTDKDN